MTRRILLVFGIVSSLLYCDAANVRWDDRVHRVSQRDVPRIPGERRPHLARDIRVTDARPSDRRSRASRPSRASRTSLRFRTATRAGLHEAQRKPDLALHALVVEAVRRRNRRRRQRLQRLRAQLQFPSSGREHAVRARDRARRADATAGRHLEVARIDALARRAPPANRGSRRAPDRCSSADSATRASAGTET